MRGSWAKVTDHLKIYVAVTAKPDDLSGPDTYLAVDTGRKGSFDSFSVNGGRIFRLNNRWYMVYQCSARNFDYPERFHVAWPDDLIHWSKVENSQPFFERGRAGEWDEGGIWFGEVFEYKDRLFMFYEGWGGEKGSANRDQPYFPGGRSQTGLASVPVDRFLRWCGHEDMKHE